MTIDKAIKHCEEVAQEKRYEYQECLAVHDMENAMECGKCGEEHEQRSEIEVGRVTDKAIEYFKFYRKIFCEDHLKILPKDSLAYQATLKEREFYDMAIKAMEQQPSEDGIEKHTDRQIYDGCIHLMQKMVDYFQEYLEYLGYDLDKLDEDERFAVGISNMEIVQWLFLFHTRNSGGCSTRDFCEKIGIDYSKRVKFEFERDEE